MFIHGVRTLGVLRSQETACKYARFIIIIISMYKKRHGSGFRNGFSNSHISCQTEFLKYFSHRTTTLRVLERPRRHCLTPVRNIV